VAEVQRRQGVGRAYRAGDRRVVAQPLVLARGVGGVPGRSGQGQLGADLRRSLDRDVGRGRDLRAIRQRDVECPGEHRDAGDAGQRAGHLGRDRVTGVLQPGHVELAARAGDRGAVAQPLVRRRHAREAPHRVGQRDELPHLGGRRQVQPGDQCQDGGPRIARVARAAGVSRAAAEGDRDGVARHGQRHQAEDGAGDDGQHRRPAVRGRHHVGGARRAGDRTVAVEPLDAGGDQAVEDVPRRHRRDAQGLADGAGATDHGAGQRLEGVRERVEDAAAVTRRRGLGRCRRPDRQAAHDQGGDDGAADGATDPVRDPVRGSVRGSVRGAVRGAVHDRHSPPVPTLLPRVVVGGM